MQNAHMRVDGAAPRGFLRFLSLTALWAEGCGGALRAQIKKRGRGWSQGLWYRPAGDEYKVSVTGFAFSVIWHDKHSGDWLAALASPYPASPDCPRSSVGQSKGRPFYGQAKGLL